MMDEAIERAAVSPRMAPALLIFAGVLLVAGLIVSVHLVFLAFALAAAALAVYLTQRKPFEMHLGYDGIEVRSPERSFIRYDRIEAVCRNNDHTGRTHSFPFVVVHRDGLLNVPAELSHSSRDIYRFLRTQMPERNLLSPPAELRRFTRFHDDKHGEQRVWSYRCLPDPVGWRNWLGVVTCAAMALVGAGWMIASSARQEVEVWLGIGGITMAISMAGFLYYLIKSSEDRGAKYVGDGGIVITPEGFALKQGRLCGQMRWDEVADLRYQPQPRNVQIEFDGGKIRLLDDYNHRLKAIYFCLLDHWELSRGISRSKKIDNLPMFDQM